MAQLVFAAVAGTSAAAACGGEFGVSPIRVELDRRVKSAVVTVTNDDRRPLAFQVRALEWTQDAAGADHYAETADLIYFPRQLKIPPRQSRVIRLGYKAPAAERERTYRLYVEELAGGAARDRAKSGISVMLRFGVPVFLRPATPLTGGTMQLSVEHGAARVVMQNTGNVHFRVAAVRYSGIGPGGETTFEGAVDGWYLLAGARRAFPIKLPADACARTRLLRAQALAEKLELRAERPLAAGDCP